MRVEIVNGGITFRIHVIPRARRPGVGGQREDALLVRVTAPPVYGAANAEAATLLAEALAVPRRSVTIRSGAAGRRKLVHVAGADAAAAMTLAGD